MMIANPDVDTHTAFRNRNDIFRRLGRGPQLSRLALLASPLMLAACNQAKPASPIEDAIYLKCDFIDLLWQKPPGPSGSMSLIVRPAEKRIEISTLHPLVSFVFDIIDDNGFSIRAVDAYDRGKEPGACVTELRLYRHEGSLDIYSSGCKDNKFEIRKGSCSKINPIF